MIVIYYIMQNSFEWQNWMIINLLVGTVVALATQQEWQMVHINVKIAFLHNDIKEEVYVEHNPKAFQSKGGNLLYVGYKKHSTGCGK